MDRLGYRRELHFLDYQTMAGGPNVPSGNMAMKHGPFIDEFPIKTSIQRGFSIAMFDYQRVCLQVQPTVEWLSHELADRWCSTLQKVFHCCE